MPARKPAQPKITVKTNPTNEGFVTVRLPKAMPKGVEYRYDHRGRSVAITSKRGLKAFFDLIGTGQKIG